MRTLHVDIETSPNLAYVWGLFKQNVGLNQIVEPSRVLCASFAWDDGPTDFVAEWQKGGARKMFRTLHSALSTTDALVHYNGKTFDTPHLFREFLERGFGPPAPFTQIDLYSAVKRQFRFASGKLAHVSDVLALGGSGKLSTDMSLWTRVLSGDQNARDEMEAYNRQDVVLLQDLYARLLPWIPQHPNVALINGNDGFERCTKCGSGNVVKNGNIFTSAGRFQRYLCRNCGAWTGLPAQRDNAAPVGGDRVRIRFRATPVILTDDRVDITVAGFPGTVASMAQGNLGRELVRLANLGARFEEREGCTCGERGACFYCRRNDDD